MNRYNVFNILTGDAFICHNIKKERRELNG